MSFMPAVICDAYWLDALKTLSMNFRPNAMHGWMAVIDLKH
jgi:hypothetical protein